MAITGTETDNYEVMRLEDRLVETAIKYVKGVGWNANSLQDEADALKQFCENHNAFWEATRALISAREK